MVKIISNLKTSVGFRPFKAFKTSSPNESCEFIPSLPIIPHNISRLKEEMDFPGFSCPSRGFPGAHGRHLLAAAPPRGSPTDRNSAFREKGSVKSTNTLLKREYCHCFHKQFKWSRKSGLFFFFHRKHYYKSVVAAVFNLPKPGIYWEQNVHKNIFVSTNKIRFLIFTK